MRIVGGKHRGRTLETPTNRDTRPTSDRAREALFNILEHGRFASSGAVFRDRPVLDAFAGTGALGLEALSRGASHATFMELAAEARKILGQNIAKLGEAARTTINIGDATRPPKAPHKVALALLDPPYGKGLVQSALLELRRQGWLGTETLIVAEIGATEIFPPIAGFKIEDERVYGAARLVFILRDV